MRGQYTDQAQNAFKGQPKPKKPSEAKRYPPPLSVRLTDEERAILERKAGDLSLSAYIRLAVLGENAPKHRTRSKKPVQDHELLGQLIGALGKSNVPNNLNQLTKAVNRGDLPLAGEAELDLKKAAFELAAIRHLLMTALGLKDGEQ